MRASSSTPLKKPAVWPLVTTPTEFNAEPSTACWMLSNRGVKLPTFSVASSAPFKYSRHVVPSYVAAAWRQAFGDRLLAFLRTHPRRVALSTLLFALGYAWGVFEAFWICHFLMMPVPVLIAVAIEVLSVTVDGILFMIPAKIGTQEGGKAAIFAALGLSSSAGFAFGVLRHVRELVWAALGLLICAWWWRTFRTAGARAVQAPWNREETLTS